ncbi:hypothetical protein [Streptomyces alfalfae]|uniref:Uncharacterized protein n=1 Tax=Streptomyces alfalfae TaxID=1642299 RepID=A0A7T4PH02_9ACTN|nr:hypothetical protein [Streptomyces alfalfae]QQC89859.1 hypothetical protein I8755_16630 [Streptomyces alfalfae]
MTRRCARGHFIPATAEPDACRCVLVPRRLRSYRFGADLWGQGLTVRRKSILTAWPTGRYL